VGTGFRIILSIICVAVMTTLIGCARHLDHAFCSAGTAALPTSTARSPRATMTVADPSFIELQVRLGALDLGDQAGFVLVRRGGHWLQLAPFPCRWRFRKSLTAT
jgi:hypothetical protein